MPYKPATVTRILEAHELYLQYRSISTCGKLMRKPVTRQRIAQLIADGVALGLFPNPIPPKNAHITQIDEARVDEALLRTGDVIKTASELGICAQSLKRYFQPSIVQAKERMKAERRRRKRQRIEHEYNDLATGLGFRPNMGTLYHTRLGTNIQSNYTPPSSFLRQQGLEEHATGCKSQTGRSNLENRALANIALAEARGIGTRELAERLAATPGGRLTDRTAQTKTISVLRRLEKDGLIEQTRDGTWIMNDRERQPIETDP